MDFTNKEEVEKLVKLCIAGDRKSQHTLYHTFYGKMLGVCLRYASCKEEAQDFLHDGFLKVFVKLQSFKCEGSLEGWIRRIIVNNTIDTIRKKRELLFSVHDENILVNLSDSQDDNSESEADLARYTELKAETIMLLVQKLTPAYKMVFNLYVLEDYSHKEIAEMLNISIGSSKSNLAKAKLRLRELFKNYINGTEE